MKKEELVKKYGKLYSEQLKIKLTNEKGFFKWFLASLLFGKPIQEGVAMNTFRLFMQKKVDTPDKILKTGWNQLVKILDDGGYVRYDFSTATKLLEIMKKLKQDYSGKITNIHKKAKDSNDLEKRLIEFKGVGPITVNIFLRELRGIWSKANPQPLPIVKRTAKKLKITLPNPKTRKFARLECALYRYWKSKM